MASGWVLSHSQGKWFFPPAHKSQKPEVRKNGIHASKQKMRHNTLPQKSQMRQLDKSNKPQALLLRQTLPPSKNQHNQRPRAQPKIRQRTQTKQHPVRQKLAVLERRAKKKRRITTRFRFQTSNLNKKESIIGK